MSYKRASLLKKLFYFNPFLLAYSTLMALPEGGEVVMGEVEFHSVDSQSCQIKASDKAIINYRKFNIGEKEHVQFIQPTSKSTVLTRVGGGDPSQIFGKLSANGRVFLVNPEGIYFGPNSSVNAGSFLASTLNIRDENFLNDKFQFSSEPGSNGKIVNEGTISASQEGFVAFFAPSIENRGAIFAKAGKVMLAAVESVTVDFSGDGLMQFLIEGDVKQTLIENYGQIEALDGSVGMSLRSAKDMVEMVVNTDGMKAASDLEISGGVIRLVNRNKVDIRGVVDVSSSDVGGKVYILADHVELSSATIDATGDRGGGSVFIGGDYQGKGDLYTAVHTVMDSNSQIYADAGQDGDGGKVILWADDKTLFNGKIFARGQGESGSGGFVETSGKNILSVQEGFVDTSASSGKYGNWLLDPNTITIATGGGGSLSQAANCGSNPGVTISPAVIASATTNVTLCAQRSTASSITVTSAITITNPNVSISLVAGSTNVGSINLNNNIVTAGAAINLTGVVSLGTNVSLDTTSAGKVSTGSDISFSNSIDGARILTLNSGTQGRVTFDGSVGGSSPLTNLTVLAANISQNSKVQTSGALTYTAANEIGVSGNITTSGSVIFMKGPVVLANNPVFDSTNSGALPKGASIRFSSAIDGSSLLTLQAGTNGNVLFSGPVGSVQPLTNLIFGSANIIQIGSDIAVAGSTPLTFPNPVSLIGASHIASSGANIVFDSALDGNMDLSLTGGSGSVIFTGAVGEGTLLTSLNVKSAAIIQSSTVQIEGPLNYEGSSIAIHGNITTSDGAIDMTGSTSFANNLVFDTTNGGMSLGAAIRFSGSLDSSDSLMLAAGTQGDVSFFGAVGRSKPLSDLFFASARSIGIGSDIVTTGANPLVFPVPVNLTGEACITSNNASISFNSTVDGEQSLMLAAGAGTVTFTADVGAGAPLASLVVAAASDINGNITTRGGAITMAGPVMLLESSMIDTTGRGDVAAGSNITFRSTVDGSIALTLQGGTSGIVSFLGAVGEVVSLTDVTAIAGMITQSSTAQIAGPLSYQAMDLINISGNVTTSGAPIDLVGNVLLANNPIFDSTGHGSLKGASIQFASRVNGATTLTLQAGSIGDISFKGSIGEESALTNLSAKGLTIAQNSTARLSDFLSYEASAIDINGDITTSGGALNMTGPVMLTSSLAFDTTNSGSSPTGAGITFSSTVDGEHCLTLVGGMGAATFTGAVGASKALESLTVESAVIAQSSTMQIAGALNYTAAKETSVHGSITTSGGAVHITGPVMLEVATAVDTTNSGAVLAGADITFLNGINGAQTLLLSAGAEGTISLAEVGESIALSSITAKAQTIKVSENITTSGGVIDMVGATLLAGSPTLDSTGKGSLPGANISFSSVVDGPAAFTILSGSGVVTFSGAVGARDALTNLTVSGNFIAQGSTLQVANFLQYKGIDETSINGNITTSGGSVNVIGPVVLSANSTIDTTNAGEVLSGADITFSKVINGDQALVLIGGNKGLISLVGAGDVTPLTSFTVAAGAIEVNGNITTKGGAIDMTGPVMFANNPVLDSSGKGMFSADIRFMGAVDGATNLTIQAGELGNVEFTGAIGGINPLTDLFFASVNGIQIGNNVTVTGSNPLNFLGSVLLTGASQIASGGANITFRSTLEGNKSLTLLAGKGSVSFARDVGKDAPLTNLTVEAGSIAQGSRVQLSDFLNYKADSATINGSITTSGGAVRMTGPVMLVAASTIDTTNAGSHPSGADIVLSNMINGDQALTLVGGTRGLVSLSEVGSREALSRFLASGGSIEVKGNITTNGGSIDLVGPVMLSSASVIDATNSGASPLGANIVFTGAVDGSADLTLQAGDLGSVSFIGATGALTRLGALTINTAHDVSMESLAANTLVMNASTGVATFKGSVDVEGSAGIRLVGNTINQFGRVVTANGGSYTVTNAGTLTATAPELNFISGSYVQNGAGPVSFAGALSTGAGSVLFSSPVTLLESLMLSTEAGGGNITFLGKVDGTLAGAQRLTMSAGSGSIFLNDNLGAQTSLGIFTIDSAAAISALGSVRASSVSVGALGGSVIDFEGSIIADSAGIDFYSPLNFVKDSSFDTSLSGGDVHFFDSLDGEVVAAFTAGSGNIFFDAAVGAGKPLTTFAIRSARDVTSTKAISAGSILQTAGSGKTTCVGTLLAANGSGISLSGSEFELCEVVTTTNSGPLYIQNSGALTLRGGCDVAAELIQTGPGLVILAGNMAAGGPVSFASNVVLSDAVTLDTSANQSNITFLNTINGSYDLTLNLGNGGDLVLEGGAGNASRLRDFLIVNAGNVRISTLTAASVTQGLGTGVTKLGSLNTDSVLGISLTGNAFAMDGNLITANSGPVTVTNAGLLALLAGSETSISGVFTQKGEGPVALAGTLSTLNTDLVFARPVALTGRTSLSTGTGVGMITFSGTLDLPGLTAQH